MSDRVHRPIRDWVTDLSASGDRHRAQAIALRLGRIGILLGGVSALLAPFAGASFQQRYALSMWWLVILHPISLLVGGYIVGGLLRHASTWPRGIAIVALAAFPTGLALFAIDQWGRSTRALSMTLWTGTIVVGSLLVGLMYGGRVCELRAAVFRDGEGQPETSSTDAR